MLNAIRRNYLALCLAILAAAATVYALSIPLRNSDLNGFVLPWYDAILANGGWQAMGLSFANYTPPYLYVLALFSNLSGVLSAIVVVKMVSIFGNFLLAAGCYFIFRLSLERQESLIFATFVLILPTVVLNSAVWGQCDAYYASAILFAIGFAMRGRWFQTTLFFGLALSLKLQAVFIGPAIAVFFFRRQIRFWMIPVPVLVYYLMMAPSMIAGRSLRSVSLIYFEQFETFKWLTANSPNMWALLQKVLYRLHFPQLSYEAGVATGLVLAMFMSVFLIVVGSRSKIAEESILTTFLVSAITIPYFLPKMHDRYFFAADVISYVCAVSYRSPLFLVISVCIQVGSFLACLGTPFGYWNGAPYGAILMTIALALTWLAFLVQAYPNLPLGKVAMLVTLSK